MFFLNTQNIYAQVSGCPDPAANNYDSAVTVNNGSCTYDNGNLKPAFNYNLSTVINETSGLVYWKKKIWTHNDSGGEPAVYQLNRETGSIERTIIINNAINVDWEDIAQDNRFFTLVILATTRKVTGKTCEFIKWQRAMSLRVIP